MNRRAKRTQRSGKLRIGVWLISLLLGSLLLTFVIGVYGQVSGEEFSPQKFSMRRFSYVQIPLLGVQVWPVKFSRLTGTDVELAKHIRKSTRQNRLMNRVQNAPPRWDIMTMAQTGGAAYRGDASILTNYLRQPGAKGMESWLDWTKANPKLSTELWSLVAFLAHEDLYPIIPEVLEAARRIDSSNFSNQIRQIVAEECLVFAKAYAEAGETKRAAEVEVLAEQIETGSL